jgi:transcriptional regulator with XRE-family HTH domain
VTELINKGKVATAFAFTVTEMRNQLGISKQELSDLIGIDRAHMSGIESGIHSPSFYLVFKIAAGLKMSPDKLLRIF